MKSGTEDFFKLKMSACPACGSEDIFPWLTKSKEGTQFSLWRCSSCQTGFMNPQPTKEYLNSIYHKSGHGLTTPISFEEVIKGETEYPNATVDAKRLVERAKIFMAGKEGLKALDIGSGYGFFTNAALKAGFRVSAVNPGKWENEIFEKLNGFSPVPQFFEEVDFASEKFHLVILSQVLEHVDDPFRFLMKIRSILNKNGIIAVAVPNIDSILVKLMKYKDNGCLWVPEHLSYYSKKGLISILDRAGFAIKSHMYISRIPYNSLSKRFGLKNNSRWLVNSIVKKLQKPPLKIINGLGFGFIHNIWAQTTH